MPGIDLLRPGQRLTVTGSGEVAELITTFNQMLDRLETERGTSAARALSAQEAERRRIAQELHDEIGQSLTAVLLELKRAGDRLPSPCAPICATRRRRPGRAWTRCAASRAASALACWTTSALSVPSPR